MDTNLFISTAPATTAVREPTNGAQVGLNTSVKGLEFKSFFENQFMPFERQSVAIPDTPESELALQMLSLGPNIELVTSAISGPDISSLADFARSQGFDEAAIGQLFGDQLQATASIHQINPQANQPGILDVASPQAVSLLPSTAETSTNTQLNNLIPSKFLKNYGRPVMLSATIYSAVSANSKTFNKSNIEQIDAGLSAENDNYPEILKVQIDPSNQAITKKLMEMSQTQKKSQWSEVKANQTTETLSLEIEPELLDSIADWNKTTDQDTLTILNQRSNTDGLGKLGNSAQGSSTGTGSQSSADQRQLQFQQLSDRLGQAMAERLMSQIERGIWKLQMRMDPASLGKIKISLDMHKDGLSAVFAADNALTRELISQGAAKLRSALIEAGMTVASVHVSSDQNRQSGGNSTREQNSPSQGESNSPKRSTERLVTSAKDRVSNHIGWDILV